MMPLGSRSAVAPWLLIVLAVVLAGCGSSSPGVEVRAASEHTSVPAEPTGEGVPSTGQPPPPITAPDPTPPTDTTDPAVPTTMPGVPIDDGGPIGVGDSLFPDLGSPLLDVTHYDIDLTYDPQAAHIEARVTLDIDAVAGFDSFTLDAVGLDVRSVVVDGVAAGFEVEDPELVISPSAPIAADQSFVVDVEYSAEADGSQVSPGVTAGWFITDDGTFTLNEPDGARSWLPSNDHPLDKATYTFTVHVPAGITAVANGMLQRHETDGQSDTWVWSIASPMTTYVIQVLTGHYEIVEDEGPNGLPLIHAIQAGDQELMQPFLDVTADQIDFLDDFFGPFPFANYGLAMTDGVIGGAMEEQTRSLFSQQDFSSGELGYYQHLLLAHELTHQWFGDAVSPAAWSDIWLNESFATYGQWMWLEHVGFETVQESADANLEQRQDGEVATGDPGRRGLFGYEVYDGGAVILHALRLQVGDVMFFDILRSWAGDGYGRSHSSADFIALVEAMTGEDYTTFFDDWLYATDLPDDFPT